MHVVEIGTRVIVFSRSTRLSTAHVHGVGFVVGFSVVAFGFSQVTSPILSDSQPDSHVTFCLQVKEKGASKEVFSSNFPPCRVVHEHFVGFINGVFDV